MVFGDGANLSIGRSGRSQEGSCHCAKVHFQVSPIYLVVQSFHHPVTKFAAQSRIAHAEHGNHGTRRVGMRKGFFMSQDLLRDLALKITIGDVPSYLYLAV